MQRIIRHAIFAGLEHELTLFARHQAWLRVEVCHFKHLHYYAVSVIQYTDNENSMSRFSVGSGAVLVE
jgi:hypothetical protein